MIQDFRGYWKRTLWHYLLSNWHTCTTSFSNQLCNTNFISFRDSDQQERELMILCVNSKLLVLMCPINFSTVFPKHMPFPSAINHIQTSTLVKSHTWTKKKQTWSLLNCELNGRKRNASRVIRYRRIVPPCRWRSW